MSMGMVSGASLTVARMSSHTAETLTDVDQEARAVQAHALETRALFDSPVDRWSGCPRRRGSIACVWVLVAMVFVVGMHQSQSPPPQIMAPGREPVLQVQASSVVDSHRLVAPDAPGR